MQRSVKKVEIRDAVMSGSMKNSNPTAFCLFYFGFSFILQEYCIDTLINISVNMPKLAKILSIKNRISKNG